MFLGSSLGAPWRATDNVHARRLGYVRLMSQMLRDLYAHQAWADAEHWRALEAQPGALQDVKLWERLHHIHIVERAFLWAMRDQSQRFEITKPEDYTTPAALKRYAREYHDEVAAFLGTLDDAGLEAAVGIPWFKDPPLRLRVIEALTQAAMHSHYHRAQNATRLRELGGEPPGTDLIVWYWKGRPAPRWD